MKDECHRDRYGSVARFKTERGFQYIDPDVAAESLPELVKVRSALLSRPGDENVRSELKETETGGDGVSGEGGGKHEHIEKENKRKIQASTKTTQSVQPYGQTPPC